MIVASKITTGVLVASLLIFIQGHQSTSHQQQLDTQMERLANACDTEDPSNPCSAQTPAFIFPTCPEGQSMSATCIDACVTAYYDACEAAKEFACEQANAICDEAGNDLSQAHDDYQSCKDNGGQESTCMRALISAVSGIADGVESDMQGLNDYLDIELELLQDELSSCLLDCCE